MAALKESESLRALAMKYELAPTQISKWKKEFVAGADQIFDQGPVSQKSESEIERERLLRIIGELKVENDFLKKNLK